MKVLFYGSVNIDSTYQVEHIVRPGETVSSSSVQENAGGKGANQAAAFAKACSLDPQEVFLAGKIGSDGLWILKKLNSFGVNTSLVKTNAPCSGRAVIQVDKKGENSILLYGGGNRLVTEEEIDGVLSHFSSDDYLFLTGEINNTRTIFNKALAKEMKIIVNPSPVNSEILNLDLSKAWGIIANETEATELRIDGSNPVTVITYGSKGSECYYNGEYFKCPAVETKAVDTTGAGDTFLGYFFSGFLRTSNVEKSLELASKASSVTVSKKGAMDSIPFAHEL